MCCNKCKPGNRLITNCGPDPHALCAPCGNDTYISDTSQKNCLRCTQCIGVMRVRVKCSASSDTVCECSQGFRCGNEKCLFCVKECVKGQQPTEDRKCQPCPPGTYNDQIHQPCMKWRRCTQPDYEIIVPGTAETNIVCGPKRQPYTTSLPDSTPTESPSDQKLLLSPPNNSSVPAESKVIAIFVTFGLLFVMISIFTILYLERRRKTLDKPQGTKKERNEETRTAQPEECSFCFPQQERGASSQTSMSSLVSEDKIMPLVG